ncbi:MAG: diacylglycerol kinase family protein [Pseudomonadota bacterium]
MAIVALINYHSGSVPPDAQDLLRHHLGNDLTRLLSCSGDELLDALDDIVLQCDDTLIVWGGDGTLSAALTASKGSGAAVLPLPGGTMNLLHKRVHGKLARWDDLLDRALRAPRPEPLTHAVANERNIYVGLTLGRLTNLAEAREALREGAPIEATKAAVAQNALDLETDIEAQIGTSSYQATAAAAFTPEGISGDELEVGLIDPDTLAGLATLSLSAMLADWRNAQGMTYRKCQHAVFRRMSGSSFDALIDGEPVDLGDEVTIRIERSDVLVRSATGSA